MGIGKILDLLKKEVINSILERYNQQISRRVVNIGYPNKKQPISQDRPFWLFLSAGYYYGDPGASKNRFVNS